MLKILYAGTIVCALTSVAHSQMDLKSMSKANGLAEIIANAETCGYAIDQSRLEAYFESNSLNTPEILSYINSMAEMAEFGNKPSASTCTMTKSTASKLGLLAQ